MALTARYLVDQSALARFNHPVVEERLRPLLDSGLMASCAIIDLEVLYSSRGLVEYEEVLDDRRRLDAAPITPEVMTLAIGLQHALAKRGQHRLPIPDLIISAAAKTAGLVVLHYDSDFERLWAAGGAMHEWVAPRGTL